MVGVGAPLPPARGACGWGCGTRQWACTLCACVRAHACAQCMPRACARAHACTRAHGAHSDMSTVHAARIRSHAHALACTPHAHNNHVHARSQAEKLNGRAAMMGYVIAIFVDKASGAGLAEQQNSFLGLLALHITVFAILAIRCARRAVRAARMHARTHALRTRAEACVASATDAPWGELVGPERGAWALHACLHAALPSTRPGACSAAPVPHQHAHTLPTPAPPCPPAPKGKCRTWTTSRTCLMRPRSTTSSGMRRGRIPSGRRRSEGSGCMHAGRGARALGAGWCRRVCGS